MERKKIGNKLINDGFHAADKGFEYLIEAVRIYRHGVLMGEIYEEVAAKFNVDLTNIERCIRHAKSKSKDFRDMDNREVIARIHWDLETQEAEHA